VFQLPFHEVYFIIVHLRFGSPELWLEHSHYLCFFRRFLILLWGRHPPPTANFNGNARNGIVGSCSMYRTRRYPMTSTNPSELSLWRYHARRWQQRRLLDFDVYHSKYKTNSDPSILALRKWKEWTRTRNGWCCHYEKALSLLVRRFFSPIN